MREVVRSHPDETAPALQRRESAERRIIAGAVELVERGVPWSQLSIRELAELAGLSRTAFYDFFGSKNEVLERLIRGLHDDMMRLLVEPATAPHLETALDHHLQDVRPSLELIADLNARYGPVYKAFLDACAQDNRLHELWHALLGQYREIAAASLRRIWEGQPDRARDDAIAAAEVLILMTERTMLVLLSEPQPVAAERRSSLLDALAIVWHRAVVPPVTA